MKLHKLGKPAFWIVLALAALSLGGEGDAASLPERNDGRGETKVEPRNTQELTDLIYRRLQTHGYINHVDFPVVLRVKQVRDSKLQFVQFMRRNPKGKGFDLVGKALEVELRANQSMQLLNAHARHAYGLKGKDTTMFLADWVWQIDVGDRPLPWPTKGGEPFSQAEGMLTAEQASFLANDCYKEPVFKKLQQAFGVECDEMLRDFIHYSPKLQLVVAANKPAPVGRVVKLTQCSTVRFDKQGTKLVSKEQATELSLSTNEFFALFND